MQPLGAELGLSSLFLFDKKLEEENEKELNCECAGSILFSMACSIANEIARGEEMVVQSVCPTVNLKKRESDFDFFFSSRNRKGERRASRLRQSLFHS